jgi:formate-dependent nitrite reductase membrane component NrfD
MFWGGAIFLGIVLPLAINLTVGKTNHQANIVGGASAIIGALFLRASVLMAGFFAPIYF